jgi:N-acetylated-alpha-linked acidic dipeptidase
MAPPRAARGTCVAAGVIVASIACATAAAVSGGAPAAAEISAATGDIEGFSTGAAAAERQLEHRFDSGLSYTGYGVKTLPGIREAIEERRWDEANRYVGVVSRALNAYSGRLDRAISAP